MTVKDHPLIKATRRWLSAKKRIDHWNGTSPLTELRRNLNETYEEYKRQAALVGIDISRWS